MSEKDKINAVEVLSPEEVKRERSLKIPEELSLRLSEERIKEVLANIDLLTKNLKDWLKPEADYTQTLFGKRDKPTLLDPGAMKIRSFFNVRPSHRILERVVEKVDGLEHTRYIVEAELVHFTGVVVASGIGSCSSREKKYRLRWVDESELREVYGYEEEDLKGIKSRRFYTGGKKVTQYFVPNPEISDLDNTLLKMAAKRAEVDATLMLPGVAEIFTQDLGEILKGPSKKAEEPKTAPLPEPREETEREAVVPSSVPSSLEEVEYRLGEHILEMGKTLDLSEGADCFFVQQKRFLEAEVWQMITDIILSMGGQWVSEGPKSHWEIPKHKEG
jgi:hypothetical protein